MELRHLRYLVAIADAGSFVRAAEQLRVAQPALSRQIHDLEEELKVELFRSGARKATLTNAGDSCVRLARHVIQDTEAAVRRARLSNVGVAGRCVLLAGPVPLLSGIVPRLILRMKSKYPGISIEVQEMYAQEQWSALLEGTADIGLSYAAGDGYEALIWETQFVHAIDHVLVAPTHPLAKLTEVTVDDLAQYEQLTLDFAGPDYEANRRALDQWFKDAGYAPKVRVLSSFDSALAHVRAGQGWSLMVRVMATRLPPLAAIRIKGWEGPFRTVRMWRRSDKRPVVRTVLKELREMQMEGGVEGAEPAENNGAMRLEEFVPARLELRHLRSFAQVARSGSLGLAAESLGITQPALSRQMKDLEHDVGSSLFERGTRGIELTDAGTTFYRDVENLMKVVDNLPKEVRRAERATEQRCVIATVPHPWVDRIVVQAIADLESRESRIRTGTRQISTPLQTAAIRAGEVDIAIGHLMPGMDTKGLARERLFHETICGLLLSPNHPLATNSSLFLKDLENVPFVFGARSFFPQLYDAIWQKFAAADLHPRIEGEYDGLRTCWLLVANGAGWTLAWDAIMDDPPEGLKALRLKDFRLPWGAELAYRQDESRAPILAAIDVLRATARQMFPLTSIATTGEFAIPSNTSRAAIS